MKFRDISDTSKKMWSTIGFTLGLIGVLIALAAFFSILNKGLFTIITPILFGIIGFILILKTRKEINDDDVKIGLVVNPVSIILGGLQIYL